MTDDEFPIFSQLSLWALLSHCWQLYFFTKGSFLLQYSLNSHPRYFQVSFHNCETNVFFSVVRGYFNPFLNHVLSYKIGYRSSTTWFHGSVEQKRKNRRVTYTSRGGSILYWPGHTSASMLKSQKQWVTKMVLNTPALIAENVFSFFEMSLRCNELMVLWVYVLWRSSLEVVNTS